MKQYVFTQHFPGHITLPELDKEGKVVMTVPDAAAVKAAIETNSKNAAKVKNSLPPGSNIRVSPIVTVPQPEPKVDREVYMSFGEKYSLPEDNADVQQYVMLGYLKEVIPPKPEPAAEKPAAKPKEVAAPKTTPSTPPAVKPGGGEEGK